MWKVPRDWPGEVAYVIAGGPSVLSQDLTLLKGRRVIVVNSSWEAFPEAQYLFFGDYRWFYQHRDKLKIGFKGRVVTPCSVTRGKEILLLKKVKPPPGICADPAKISMFFTSLQGALNLSVHLGARRIVLLGADMRPASDGRTHHHEPHPWPQKRDCWDKQMIDLETTVRPLADMGIEVINTSLESRLTWWPKMRLEDCL